MQISTSQTRGKILRHHLATKTTPDRTEKLRCWKKCIISNDFLVLWMVFPAFGICPCVILNQKIDSVVDISWLPNFFLWVFRGSKIFSRGILWVRNFFLWVFRDSKFLIYWQHEKQWERREVQKHITDHAAFSKSISTIISSAYTRKVLHLSNYLCYYTAFICTNCILHSLHLY